MEIIGVIVAGIIIGLLVPAGSPFKSATELIDGVAGDLGVRAAAGAGPRGGARHGGRPDR